jgi:hypothetical protein
MKEIKRLETYHIFWVCAQNDLYGLFDILIS